MKNHTHNRIVELHPGAAFASLLALLLAAAPTNAARAEDTNSVSSTEQKAEKPPPLPLHQIEGNGGIFSTLSAYLVNPPRDGEAIGRPAAGFSFVDLGYGRELVALTATETPWKRLELGFGYENFNLGDLPKDILQTTGVQYPGPDRVALQLQRPAPVAQGE